MAGSGRAKKDSIGWLCLLRGLQREPKGVGSASRYLLPPSFSLFCIESAADLAPPGELDTNCDILTAENVRQWPTEWEKYLV